MAEQASANKKRAGLAVGAWPLKLLDAIHLYICMCLSGELVGNVLFGGAVCLAGQVLVVFVRLYSGKYTRLLPRGMQARGIILLAASGFLTLALLLLYPALAWNPNIAPLLLVIALLLLRQGVTAALARTPQLKKIARALILFLTHAFLSAVVLLLIAPRIQTTAYHDIMLMVIVTGVALLALQILLPMSVPVEQWPDPDELQKISAYRIYNRMVESAAVALNLALVTYICMTGTAESPSLIQAFWDLALWLMLVGGLVALALAFMRRRGFSQYDQPSMFILGALCVTLAITGTYNSWFTGWGALPGYFLWGAGLSLILSIIISLGIDMRDVLELEMKPEELKGYQLNTQATVEWSLTFSMLLVLVMLTLMSFIGEGYVDAYKGLPAVRFMMNTMASWPVILIGISLLYALLQPLNRDYAKKLAHYRALQRQGQANPVLRTRLQLMLAKRSHRILPDLLRAVLRPIMPCRAIGKERVDVEHGPVVFVSNHLEVYGPIIVNLHLRFYFRSWIIASMLDKELVAEQLASGGIDKVFHWLPEKLRHKLPHLIAPIMVYILQSLDPIPVYRDTMRGVIKTIRLSVDAMEYEDNILLFPENPEEGGYQSAGASEFYSGFASIGAEYYKRTGQCTTFYPIYVDKTKRTMTIGEGIRFNPENGYKQEKTRIVEALRNHMNEQAT